MLLWLGLLIADTTGKGHSGWRRRLFRSRGQRVKDSVWTFVCPAIVVAQRRSCWLTRQRYATWRISVLLTQYAQIGMSACCSLDELGKPSFVEHRSCLPPCQIARASSGRTPATRLTTLQARTSQAGRGGSCSPMQLQQRRVPAAARRTPGGRTDVAPAAGHASPIRDHAPVVPGRGSQSSD